LEPGGDPVITDAVVVKELPESLVFLGNLSSRNLDFLGSGDALLLEQSKSSLDISHVLLLAGAVSPLVLPHAIGGLGILCLGTE
jgi:hypothetical protein